MYDLDGIRLPFYLKSPKGEIVDAAYVPSGFQLRTGFTESGRFLDFQVPVGDPTRYAGRWQLIVRHDGHICYGSPDPRENKDLGFLPNQCRSSSNSVEYAFAIGVGSNFRLQAYTTPAPVSVGEPIRLTGVPSEAGLSVTGCAVSVEARSPNGTIWNFSLEDDGAHEDGDAMDGEYARPFMNTAVAGSYTFTFRASGLTRDGEPVNREVVRSKYVNGPMNEWPTHEPQNGTGGTNDCCHEIERLLERQNQLLKAVLQK